MKLRFDVTLSSNPEMLIYALAALHGALKMKMRSLKFLIFIASSQKELGVIPFWLDSSHGSFDNLDYQVIILVGCTGAIIPSVRRFSLGPVGASRNIPLLKSVWLLCGMPRKF